MFEVYLNIIEGGPGIYGNKPAAWSIYKEASELNLTESNYPTR
jgi:membrane peptidoglycan carboxypeptidase